MGTTATTAFFLTKVAKIRRATAGRTNQYVFFFLGTSRAKHPVARSRAAAMIVSFHNVFSWLYAHGETKIAIIAKDAHLLFRMRCANTASRNTARK